MKNSISSKPLFCLAGLGLLFTLLSGESYAGSNIVTSQGTPIRWKANTAIPYVVNPGGVPGLTGELQKLLVAGAVNDAFRAWTEIPGASIAFTNEGTSELTVGAIDGVNLVTFQDTTMSLPPGVLAVASPVFAPSAGMIRVGDKVVNAEFAGQILEADIVFNTSEVFSPLGMDNTVDLVAVALHEIGHLLGLDHSGVFSSIMNPFSESGAGVANRTLQTDDTITAAVLYPAQTFAADTGAIAGKITSSTGAPVRTAHVIAVNFPDGVPVASQLSGADGSFRIAGLEPEDYRVMVEPLDGPIGQIDFPGFFSDGQFDFATTFLGGLATPTKVTVTAGQDTPADIPLPATDPNQLNVTVLGIATPTQTGTSFLFGSSPLFLPRGNSYQVFVSATNQGSGSNLTFTGPDIVPQGGTVDGVIIGSQAARQRNITISGTADVDPFNLLLSNSSSASAMPGGVVVTVNPNVPTPDSLVDAAGFRAGIAPGTIISIFGSDLALGIKLAADTPLPTNLGGISVKMGGRFAPLFFVSPGQINAMVPFELSGSSTDVTVVTGPNAAGNTVTVNLNPTAPGIFVLNSAGQGAIVNADGSIAAPAGSFPGRGPPDRPAKPGEVIVIFASGLGPVTPPWPSGLASGADGATFPKMVSLPQVLIGGQPLPAANVLFAGLAPSFVGLYQVNVRLPDNVQTGDTVPVKIITAEGQTSNEVIIAVQNGAVTTGPGPPRTLSLISGG